jgi:hypothetical protein
VHRERRMPDKNVYLIVNRAFVDEQFRQQLEADLEGTVTSMGIKLSDEGLAELMAALDEGGDFATGLDQRLSQSGISLNPAALLRQKTAGGKQAAELGPLASFRGGKKARHHERRVMKDADVTPVVTAITEEPLEADELDIEVEND